VQVDEIRKESSAVQTTGTTFGGSGEDLCRIITWGGQPKGSRLKIKKGQCKTARNFPERKAAKARAKKTVVAAGTISDTRDGHDLPHQAVRQAVQRQSSAAAEQRSGEAGTQQRRDATTQGRSQAVKQPSSNAAKQ
jgi:hypothetical protein